MEQARHLLNKARSRMEGQLKDAVGDIYYYEELNPYVSQTVKAKKTKNLEKKKAQLREGLEEIDFLIDLMDKAGIDEIFSKHRRETAPLYKNN